MTKTILSRQRTTSSTRIALAATVFVAAFTLAACGSTSATSAGPAGSEPAAAPVAVPAGLKGMTMTVAVTVFSPFELYDSNNNLGGADIDLYQELGRVLGVTFTPKVVDFDGIVPGLESGRYQAASPLGDFVERQQVIDLVDYSQGSSSLLVSGKGSYRPTNVSDLCGHTIGIEKGSAEVGVTGTLNDRCAAGGKPAIDLRLYPNVSAADLAVQSGRVDGVLTDSAPNGYTAEQSGGLFANAPLAGGSDIAGWGATFGIAVAKNSPLAQPLEQALKELIANGTYDRIYQKWGISGNEITAARVKIDGSTAHQG
jgi:polar amino acid transport system substrate-binding protein